MGVGQQNTNRQQDNGNEDWDALKGDVGDIAGAAVERSRYFIDSAREQATDYVDRRNMPSGGNGREAKRGNGNGRADATAFWELYHQQAKPAGIPIKVAQGLANKGDWAAACPVSDCSLVRLSLTSEKAVAYR